MGVDGGRGRGEGLESERQQVLTVAKTAVSRATESQKVKVGGGRRGGQGGRREEKEEAGLSRPGQDP